MFQSRYLSSKAEINFHNTEKARLLSEATELEQLVSASEKDLLSLDDRIGDLQSQIDAVMGGENAGLTNEIRQLQLSIDRNKDKIDDSESADVEDTQLLEKLEGEITEAKNNLQIHLESIKSAKEEMENSLEVLKNLEDQENAIRESLESSGSETAKLSKALKDATSDFETCQEAVQKANVAMSKIAGEAEIIAEQLSSAQEEEADAQLNFDDIELQIEDLGEGGQQKDRTQLAEELVQSQNAEQKLLKSQVL